MRVFHARLKPVLYLCAALLVALPILVALPQHAAQRSGTSSVLFTIDPAQSSVHWTLGSSLHTVHGTFALKSGNLQVDPDKGKASGEIVVDASSGQSGNEGRDKKMHKEVLESARFSEIIFRPDNISGKLEPQGDSTVQIHGIFVLHGSEHEFTVPAQANISGNHWTGSAKFSVPFIEWGLKNPSTWLLKVDHSVSIELELKGTVQGSKDKSSPGLVFDNPQDNGKAEKGKDQVLVFVAQQMGTYEFKCAKVCGIHHGRMKGKLIAEE